MPSSRKDPREDRTSGVVYTPPYMARFIVSRTLAPLADFITTVPPRIVDPACGDGVFLREAYRWLEEALVEREGRPTSRRRVDLFGAAVHGVDTDPSAVENARRGLARLFESDRGIDRRSRERLEYYLRRNLRVGNALLDSCDLPAGETDLRTSAKFAWESCFPHVFRRKEAGFDAVVANPPYLNIRRITRSQGESFKRVLKDRYRCATGGFDLYVLFQERAWRLLRPGGRCGMIVPNKIATMNYARACRELLATRTTVEHVVDVASLSVFPGTSVFPYVIVWRKEEPSRGHLVSVRRVPSRDALSDGREDRRVPQDRLFTSRGMATHGVLDVESRAATAPLNRISRLSSGTTGFSAERMAECIREGDSVKGRHLDFIVSRNIDRYAIVPGNVRFMRRTFRRPVLPDGTPQVSPGKWALYRSRKIVVAGMTKRLEAAYDARGVALGVQVYAATEMREEPLFLLALLNSRLFSFLFRIRYQAKRLSGDYLAINKGQLGELPIPTGTSRGSEGGRARGRIIERAERRMEIEGSAAGGGEHREEVAELEREIDRDVYRLFRLTENEVRQVESCFES